MDHKKCLYIISKACLKVAQILKFLIFGQYNVYRFFFHPILMQFFSLNWLWQEFPVLCRRISRDKLIRTTAEFLNLNFFILYPILMLFFLQNDHLYGLLMDHKVFFYYFISKKVLKRAKILKFRIFARHI
jgi:hypothetical protein